MPTEAEYRAFFVAHKGTGREPPVHRMMGFDLQQLSPTTILTMPLSDELRGSAEGTIHGGLLATFADVASAMALWNSFDTDIELPVTTDLHMRYYRQPGSGPLRAEATVVHRGRRLLSTECSVSDGDGRVLARSTATYMIVPLTTPSDPT